MISEMTCSGPILRGSAAREITDGARLCRSDQPQQNHNEDMEIILHGLNFRSAAAYLICPCDYRSICEDSSMAEGDSRQHTQTSVKLFSVFSETDCHLLGLDRIDSA